MDATERPRFRRYGEDPSSAGNGPREFLNADEWRARRRLVGVQDIVDDLMAKVAGGRAGPGAALQAVWNDVVGEAFAAKTRPGSCKSGKLVVQVVDGATASKMRFMTSQILQKASGIVGEGVVTSLSFRVTPGLGS